MMRILLHFEEEEALVLLASFLLLFILVCVFIFYAYMHVSVSIFTYLIHPPHAHALTHFPPFHIHDTATKRSSSPQLDLQPCCFSCL
jgi:hypothetical protein